MSFSFLFQIVWLNTILCITNTDPTQSARVMNKTNLILETDILSETNETPTNFQEKAVTNPTNEETVKEELYLSLGISCLVFVLLLIILVVIKVMFFKASTVKKDSITAKNDMLSKQKCEPVLVKNGANSPELDKNLNRPVPVANQMIVANENKQNALNTTINPPKNTGALCTTSPIAVSSITAERDRRVNFSDKSNAKINPPKNTGIPCVTSPIAVSSITAERDRRVNFSDKSNAKINPPKNTGILCVTSPIAVSSITAKRDRRVNFGPDEVYYFEKGRSQYEGEQSECSVSSLSTSSPNSSKGWSNKESRINKDSALKAKETPVTQFFNLINNIAATLIIKPRKTETLKQTEKKVTKYTSV